MLQQCDRRILCIIFFGNDGSFSTDSENYSKHKKYCIRLKYNAKSSALKNTQFIITVGQVNMLERSIISPKPLHVYLHRITIEISQNRKNIFFKAQNYTEWYHLRNLGIFFG